jgi:REP element-mobilizing transposase RayT
MATPAFNLASPPGFRGLDPEFPVSIYHRHLPHWRQRGATYFVTFRLADSIPQEQLRTLKRWREIWDRQHPEPRSQRDWEGLVREIARKTEVWLDQGYGDCVFRDRQLAEEMSRALLYFQNDRCLTSCFTVMPNHIHAIIKPLATFTLEELLKSVKQFVTRQVNTTIDRTGALWQEESYDRIIRDEEHLFRVVQYIGRNAANAGIPPEKRVRWLHPDWHGAGWHFRDA